MRFLLALLLVVSVMAGVSKRAEAHSFGVGGPPHTHLFNPGCSGTNCYRWILVNGQIMQGPQAHLTGQWGYIGVICSFKQALAGQIIWKINKTIRNLWGLTGLGHPYCAKPAYGPLIGGTRTPWSLRP